VEAAGFGKVEAKDVTITVGGTQEFPVTLAVATGKEVVEVSSQAELVETSRTSTTDTIGQRRIDNLPINGRNYINFTLTDSQVVRDNAPNTGAAPTSGLNMSGQRARANLVNVDGADATDNATNGVRSTVSQEDVQEFQIITNNYAAEYGRASGGVVNIITRSGSNDFHGDVFGYLRNRNFQAVNPFSTVPNPAYTRVQAGAAFGGTIKKDMTYFISPTKSPVATRQVSPTSVPTTSGWCPLIPQPRREERSRCPWELFKSRRNKQLSWAPDWLSWHNRIQLFSGCWRLPLYRSMRRWWARPPVRQRKEFGRQDSYRASAEAG
jgi:hypothetical protein